MNTCFSHLTVSTRAYWDSVADAYDQDFESTLIGRLKRAAVWRDLDRAFVSGQRVLEINCGTGIDALHLAERGVRVVACDISQRMIELARLRVNSTGFSNSIQFRALATEEIGTLIDDKGRFDGAFSNFSGLNCVEDLRSVSRNLSQLLHPGARALFCMLGRFVPWEIIWFAAHGEFRRALRRLSGPTTRAVPGGTLNVAYPSANQIAQAFAEHFKLRRFSGIGICVPPSYMEHWARRFPKAVSAFASADRLLGNLPGFRSMADCILLELEREGDS
jgi:2-polyprenyl-3-methyl-5-hydroxy-6-metoxy-1,4-benzoquinol methylase